MDIGLIGLGNLGAPIAKNLIGAGYRLWVYDLNPHSAGWLRDLGAAWSASPRELAGQVGVVLTVLPSPEAVEEVVAGRSGILLGLKEGGTWIDITTNDLNVVRKLAGMAENQGVDTLEAPVTGGIPRAHSGEITVFVGGKKSVFERNKPILEAIGGEVIYLGPVGSASIAKIITNMLAFVHLWALGEGLMLGKQAGMEVGPLFEAILKSCGSSFVAETEGPEILNGSYDYGFTMALAAKDANLAYQLARQVGVPLELGGLVEQIFARARRKYGDQAWSTQVVKLLEDDLGTDLRAPGYDSPRITRPGLGKGVSAQG